jgi:hypothetical protein
MNCKGSILQIVLITFLIFCFCLNACLFIIQDQAKTKYFIDIIFKQKNMEILLVEYFVEQMENGILMSDSYEEENHDVSYTVDDMGEYNEVVTTYTIKGISYKFLVWIDSDDYHVLKFEYMEV